MMPFSPTYMMMLVFILVRSLFGVVTPLLLLLLQHQHKRGRPGGLVSIPKRLVMATLTQWQSVALVKQKSCVRSAQVAMVVCAMLTAFFFIVWHHLE